MRFISIFTVEKKKEKEEEKGETQAEKRDGVAGKKKDQFFLFFTFSEKERKINSRSLAD